MINTRRQEKGHRWFAFCYSRFIASAEQRRYGEPRRRLMDGLRGRAVEIGVGSGTSLSYYSPDVHVVATEPDPYMLARAKRKVAELGRNDIEVRQAPAERLPFEDASFDHAFCSWVLCTVDDLDQTLVEVRRVLKPEGTFDSWSTCATSRAASGAWPRT